MTNNIEFIGDIEGYMYNKYPWLMRSLQKYQALLPNGYYLSIVDGGRYSEYEVCIRKSPDKSPWRWFHKHQDNNIKELLEEKLHLLCTAFTSSGIDKVVAFAKLNQLAKEIWQTIELPNLEIRLINSNNEVFYGYLSNLYFIDDCFYVRNPDDSIKKVRYAGMDLGIRDRNGEKVYEGDIVLAKTNEERGGRRFWGLVAELGNTSNPNGNLNQIVLYHGGNSYPSYLYLSEGEFEVLANYFGDTDHDFKRCQDFDTKYDWRLYEDLCESRAVELGWPKY